MLWALDLTKYFSGAQAECSSLIFLEVILLELLSLPSGANIMLAT